MVFFHVGMGKSAVFDMFEETSGGKQRSAGFTALQGMSADDLVSDENRSNTVRIFRLDGSGRADVGAGAAADAQPFGRNNEVFTLPLLQLESSGTDYFLTDTDTQPAPNAAVGWGSEVHSVLFRQLSDPCSLRRHLQEVSERLGPGFEDHLALCG